MTANKKGWIQMLTAKKGDWVQIHNVVLSAGQRAPQVPEDTQACDLELWVKGIAQSDAKEGETLEVMTVTGRIVKGTLCDVNPKYTHTYGDFVPELLKVDFQVKDILFGGDK